MTDSKATTVRTIPQLIKTLNTIHAKALHTVGKAEQLWITLGCELKEAKARHKEDSDLTWQQFAKKHFDFSRARADQLIRIADGRTTVEDERADGAARAAKAKAKLKAAVSNSGSVATHAPPNYAQDPDIDDEDEVDDEDAKQEFLELAYSVAGNAHQDFSNLIVDGQILVAALDAADSWAQLVDKLKTAHAARAITSQ
jgi:hypothetical protein